ncbi:MAG: pseudouridine synthase [Linnemannia elongata]|nr:MAG: pseudouridine synthase [Linnemannia elongata]
MVSRSLISLSLKLSTSSSSCITNTTKPKTPKHVPLTGLFAVNKPSGITSTTILDHLQHVCKRNQSHPLVKGVLEVDGSKRAQKRGLVKIGHGGTLDPLARGIVVVGMGTGCKKLHNMSGSSKVYIAEARLGYSSTTLDSTGSLVDQKPTDHITKERLLDALQAFKGEISQTPPLYSALNMDGKRLYDYAREGIPLPREIPSRKVQIHGLDLLSYPDEVTVPDPCLQAFGFQFDTDSSDASMNYSPAFNSCDSVTLSGGEGDKSTSRSIDGIKDEEEQKTFRPKKFSDPTLTDPTHIPIPPPTFGDKSLYFHIRVHCSSGTYIRTLIADIASHLGTVGLMTDLLRVEQSGYRLGGPATLQMRECEDLERVEDAIQAGNRIWDERTRQHQE